MTLPAILPHPSFSRRQFIGVAASAGGAALVAGGLLAEGLGAGGAHLASWLDPVVSFHTDAPYLDQTGLARPFHARISTAWADGLDREALLRLGHTI